MSLSELFGLVAAGLLVAAIIYFFLPKRPGPTAYTFAEPLRAAPARSEPAVNLVGLLRQHKRERDEEHEIEQAKTTLDSLTRWASRPDPPPASPGPNA